MHEIQAEIQTLEGMNCFFCSPSSLNPLGLHMVFEPISSGARAVITVSRTFQGYPGMIHGGILSGILDETMAYAGIFALHRLPVTKKLEVCFRAKVQAQKLFSCEARVDFRRDAEYQASAEIRDEKHRRLVVAHASFSLLTAATAERLLCTTHQAILKQFLVPRPLHN
jgi:acyl-coenzyme A thioesterase PaaI-like protein